MKNKYTTSVFDFLAKETLREPLHDALRLITAELDVKYLHLYQSLLDLEKAFENQHKDSDITVRIIGEFSAGKSRLLCELLKDLIPQKLLPVSRRTRETIVPLEITYGDKIALWEVRKENDENIKPEQIREWKHFPQRDEFKLSKEELKTHRLRLTIPKQELILDQHPSYSDDKGPFRIFLIDTPGWNSGELDTSKTTLAGDEVLASVYVIQASRIDSKTNQDELKKAWEDIYNNATFIDKENLLIYVTHWEETENPDWQARFEKRLHDIANEVGFDDFQIHIEYLNFNNMDSLSLSNFRINFWKHLYAGHTKAVHPVFSPDIIIKNWDLLPQLKIVADKISIGTQIMKKFKTNNQFIPGMNMTRLKTYPQHKWKNILEKKWGIITNCDSLVKDIKTLDFDHPLSVWWNDIFLRQVKSGLFNIEQLILYANQVVKQLHPDINDLEQYLSLQLEQSYKETVNEFFWAKNMLKPLLIKLLNKEKSLTKIIATLITLSICQQFKEQINKTNDLKTRAEKAEFKFKKYSQKNYEKQPAIKMKKNKYGSSIKCSITGMNFNYIPYGTFSMGSVNDHKEQPMHNVSLTNSFFMQTTVVTKKQWYEVMRNRPWYGEKNVSCYLNSPAVYISWNDCQKYIAKINSISDNVYRLPTEAEWEYSARAGSTTAYCFGNSLDELSQYSQYSMVSSPYSSAGVVARKEPNNWGLYDIHGNVMEWCQDWHGAYLSGSAIDPKGCSSGSNRVVRGGSWHNSAWGCRSAYRNGYNPATRDSIIGFRLVCLPY